MDGVDEMRWMIGMEMDDGQVQGCVSECAKVGG